MDPGQRKRHKDFLRPWSLRSRFLYKAPTVSTVNPQAHNFALHLATIHLVFHTMFSRIAALTLVALPLLAAATPLDVRGGGGEPASSCSTGDLQCCNSVQSVSSESLALPFSSCSPRCSQQRPATPPLRPSSEGLESPSRVSLARSA